MTNDTERARVNKSQPEFSKQYRNENATRWSDKSSNPCVKVTPIFLALLYKLQSIEDSST